MKFALLVFALFNAQPAHAAYKLAGNEANGFFALLRLSGAVVETAGTTQRTHAVNVICLAGTKTDGTSYKVCTFNSGGNRSVPVGSVLAFMDLMRSSGIPVRSSGSATVIRSSAVDCVTFNYNGHVPSTTCALAQ